MKKKIVKKNKITKISKKKLMINHPRSSEKKNRLSPISKIKIVLVILIILLFIYSLFLGIVETKYQTPTDKQVLQKLVNNEIVVISSYKPEMIGDPFVNKINNSEYYVVIYPSLRITYDYYNDQVKSVYYITKTING